MLQTNLKFFFLDQLKEMRKSYTQRHQEELDSVIKEEEADEEVSDGQISYNAPTTISECEVSMINSKYNQTSFTQIVICPLKLLTIKRVQVRDCKKMQ